MSLDTSKIVAHMEVLAVDGETIGKVDHMQDGKIKLTKERLAGQSASYGASRLGRSDRRSHPPQQDTERDKNRLSAHF